MTLRVAVFFFVLSLMVLAALPIADPWRVVIGGAIYLVLIWPKIDR